MKADGSGSKPVAWSADCEDANGVWNTDDDRKPVQATKDQWSLCSRSSTAMMVWVLL